MCCCLKTKHCLRLAIRAHTEICTIVTTASARVPAIALGTPTLVLNPVKLVVIQTVEYATIAPIATYTEEREVSTRTL